MKYNLVTSLEVWLVELFFPMTMNTHAECILRQSSLFIWKILVHPWLFLLRSYQKLHKVHILCLNRQTGSSFTVGCSCRLSISWMNGNGRLINTFGWKKSTNHSRLKCIFHLIEIIFHSHLFRSLLKCMKNACQSFLNAGFEETKPLFV